MPPWMDPREALKTARETIAAVQDVVSVRRVYGKPVERDGVTKGARISGPVQPQLHLAGAERHALAASGRHQ